MHARILMHLFVIAKDPNIIREPLWEPAQVRGRPGRQDPKPPPCRSPPSRCPRDLRLPTGFASADARVCLQPRGGTGSLFLQCVQAHCNCAGSLPSFLQCVQAHCPLQGCCGTTMALHTWIAHLGPHVAPIWMAQYSRRAATQGQVGLHQRPILLLGPNSTPAPWSEPHPGPCPLPNSTQPPPIIGVLA